MTQFSITTQDRQVLDFVAKGEAVRVGDPYTSLNPNTSDPRIVQYTIAELLTFQSTRPRNRKAAGRYQFMPDTLRETAQSAGIDINNTRFTPTIQDFLILKRLELRRQYNQWKSSAISDDDFLLNLSKEFASIPVPRPVPAGDPYPIVNLATGNSFFAGVAGNRVVGHANVDALLQELADIRTGGPGATINLSDEFSLAASSGGSGLLESVGRQASGGTSLAMNSRNRNAPNSELPGVDDPYLYRSIHPLDNRYDFRTGEKVRDLLYNGINPMSATSGLVGNNTVLSNIGESPRDPKTETVPVFGYSTGQVNPESAEGLLKQKQATATTAPQTIEDTTKVEHYSYFDDGSPSIDLAPVYSSQFPFIHPEDASVPIHTFDTGDRRVDYVNTFKKPFQLPASEGEFVVTRTNDQGGEIIIYVFQETNQFWFPFTVPGYEAEGETVPFKDLDFIVRQPV